MFYPTFSKQITFSLLRRCLHNSSIWYQTEKCSTAIIKTDPIEDVQKDLSDTKCRLEEVQRMLRRDNLRFCGLESRKEMSTRSLIKKMCRDKLSINIKPWDISYSYSLTNKDGKMTIVVKFANRAVRDKIYKNKCKLKAANVVVREDLTPSKVFLMKEVSKRMGMKHTWTHNGKVYTKKGDKAVEIKTLSELLKLSEVEE